MTIENSGLDIESKTDEICFTFPSTLDYIDEVIIEAIEYLYLKMEGIKQHAFAINLVLREGLTNAVRHGNENNPDKSVKLSLDVSNNPLIKIAIEDQGNGFDWKQQQDAEPLDEDEHGRGMIIIESYFTNYGYNEKGNILYLEKDTTD